MKREKYSLNIQTWNKWLMRPDVRLLLAWIIAFPMTKQKRPPISPNIDAAVKLLLRLSTMETNPVLFWLEQLSPRQVRTVYRLHVSALCFLLTSLYTPLNKQGLLNRYTQAEALQSMLRVGLTKLIVACGKSSGYESAAPQQWCENTTDPSDTHLQTTEAWHLLTDQCSSADGPVMSACHLWLIEHAQQKWIRWRTEGKLLFLRTSLWNGSLFFYF